MFQNRLKALLFCGLALALVGASLGCKDTPAPSAKKKNTEKSKAVAEPKAAMEADREAFGVPFPPEVTSVQRTDLMVRVTTKLKLADVKSFYKSKLVDYELVETRFTLKYYGLRDYMPRIRAKQLAFKSPTIIEIIDRSAAKNKPPKIVTKDGVVVPPKRAEPPENGEAVLTKTSTGELLAPGARWGEPYTPPKGSPLASKRYRSHWGKPYGKWSGQ